MKYKQVCLLGLGYIGLPTATVLAQTGQKVLGIDINPKVVDIINKGKIHIIEPGLEKAVREAVNSRKLSASDKPEESDVYVIVVPTPFKHNFEPDISYVEEATTSIVPLLKEGDLYIIESTSPVGTTEKMASIIFSARPELKNKIGVAYCPERVLPGNVLFELINNDRVIGGIDETSTDMAVEFYSSFVKGQLHKTNSKTAELCKLTENSSRDVQIAFANELSIICDKAGINVWELISLANKHPRVNILTPGCGVGGHCIAVDPYFITSEFPREAQMIAKGRETNNYKAFWCIEKINDEIKQFELKNKRLPRVALMGLAFKPNIDDLRESPASYVVQHVIQKQDCDFFICEPHIKEHQLFKITDVNFAYKSSDIVVFLVAHDEFKALESIDHKIELDFSGVRV